MRATTRAELKTEIIRCEIVRLEESVDEYKRDAEWCRENGTEEQAQDSDCQVEVFREMIAALKNIK